MTVALGWVVVDRRIGEDTWQVRHEGPAWESIDQAQAELDACAAFDRRSEWMLARLIPAGDVIPGRGIEARP